MRMQKQIDLLETVRAHEKDIFCEVIQKFITSLEYEKIKEKRDELRLLKKNDLWPVLDRFIAQHDLVI